MIGQFPVHGNQVNRIVIADGISIVKETECVEESTNGKRSKQPQNKIRSSDKGDQSE